MVCSILEGEAVHTEMIFPGNPVRIVFEEKTGDIIDWIFEHGIGHHWMIGYGHFAAEIRAWGKVVGDSLKIEELV